MIQLPEPADWTLEVVEVLDVTPSMRRIRLTGSRAAAAPDGTVDGETVPPSPVDPPLDLRTLEYVPGQDMAIRIATGPTSSVRRRYTIRHLDRESGTVDVDLVVHGDGPGARWARAVEVGDGLEAVAPRGKVVLDDTADWHLFAGDDSYLPAIAAMAATLGEEALAVIEVDGPADEQEITTRSASALAVSWLHRDGIQSGASELLPAALVVLELPEGNGHAYLGGELQVVKAMQEVLVGRGLDLGQISAKPYWRLGRRNQPHGEPERD